MLEVLIFLFENYMIEDGDYQPDSESLTVELSRAGFDNDEIDRAFDWLENLSVMCETDNDSLPMTEVASARHYTAEEQLRIDLPAQSLLLTLEQSGVLDAAAREMVVDSIMALDSDDIDIDDVKWVIMMVLCNRPNREHVYPWAEDLVVDGIKAHLH